MEERLPLNPREENHQGPSRSPRWQFAALLGLKMPKPPKSMLQGLPKWGLPRQLQRPRASAPEHRAWPPAASDQPGLPSPAVRETGFLREDCPPWKGQRDPSWLALLLRPPPPKCLFLILAWAGMWLHACPRSYFGGSSASPSLWPVSPLVLAPEGLPSQFSHHPFPTSCQKKKCKARGLRAKFKLPQSPTRLSHPQSCPGLLPPFPGLPPFLLPPTPQLQGLGGVFQVTGP